MIYSYDNEARRRLSLGRGVDNEFLSFVLLEKICFGLLRPVLENFTNNNQEISIFIRKVVSKFTPEEIKNIYEAGSIKSIVLFLDYLQEKQILFPKNRTDLLAFISDFSNR